jgi:hypothetical protein
MVAIVFALVLGALAYARMLSRNTFLLRNPFGSEYNLPAAKHGSERIAEAKLAARACRLARLHIRDFGVGRRERFMADWRGIEARFIDHPKGAVTEADELVSSLLMARGYPVSGFELSLDDVSINHSRIVEYYLCAHTVAVRPGRVSTEELRSAMLDFRTLFDELVQPQPPVELKPAC